jgi:hypothetical protein
MGTTLSARHKRLAQCPEMGLGSFGNTGCAAGGWWVTSLSARQNGLAQCPEMGLGSFGMNILDESIITEYTPDGASPLMISIGDSVNPSRPGESGACWIW